MPHVHGIQVSDGGVPKLAVQRVEVLGDGLVGDRQRSLEFHGGPDRAVCLLGLDVIESLAGDGHPIVPGSTGDNLTLAGLDWSTVGLGDRFRFAGGVELEVASWAVPCDIIADSFTDGGFQRLSSRTPPGQARAYARVLRTGAIAQGEQLELVPGPR